MDESKIFVLDTVSAGFVGLVQPWSKIVVEMISQPGGKPAATLINLIFPRFRERQGVL